MVNENAFWREVMDHLPHLMMVFRIDEFEQAHLIFVNPHINKWLGYTPKEFVLEAENEDELAKTLKDMVDEIARRSHQIDAPEPKPVLLKDRSGREHAFSYEYSLFQTKQSKTPMLAVALSRYRPDHKQHLKEDAQAAEEGRLQPVRAIELQEPMFIANSQIMKSVLQRFHSMIQQKSNLLLRGEQGIGKGTFLKKAIQQLEDQGIQVMRMRDHATQLTDLFEAPSGAAISVSDIDDLSAEQQQVLKQIVAYREKQRLETQWLATSVANLEAETEAGRFDMELYYQLNFSSLLLPPLSHRRDDLPEIISTYLAKASHILNIKLPEIPTTIVNELLDRDLKGNFNDLYRLLAEGLISSAGQTTFQLPHKVTQRKKGQRTAQDTIIKPFDHFVRDYLSEVLKETGGRIYGKNGAAKLLRLAPTTLQSKLKKYGIK